MGKRSPFWTAATSRPRHLVDGQEVDLEGLTLGNQPLQGVKKILGDGHTVAADNKRIFGPAGPV